MSGVGTGATLQDDLRRVGFLDARDEREAAGDGRWFEKNLVVTRPDLLDRCVERLVGLLPDDVDRLAASGPASIALAVGIALQARIPLILAGEGGFVGDGYPGARVALIADVLLSGDTATSCARDLKDAGFVVAGVVALLDRGRGAAASLGAQGIPVWSGFTERELLVR